MDQITVLCFGDSNTWGYQSSNHRRYPRSIRYPGVLQKRLGNRFFVIEEGLCGRTIGFANESKPFTNSLPYITPCLLSHSPLDYIVVMLGTNDLKTCYHSSPAMITRCMKELIQTVKQTLTQPIQNSPKILLIAPSPMDERIVTDPEFDLSAVSNSKELPALLSALAKEEDIFFLNPIACPLTLDADGCHLTKEAHTILAEAVYNKIMDHFPSK